MFEHDSTPEEVASSLQVMFFESKDKNIIKYLRALANPLTQYEQIRIAQSHLVSAVKGMAAHTASKAKKVTTRTHSRMGIGSICCHSIVVC
jgi:hypothetical protein